MIEIVELTVANKNDLNKANQPFDIIGRLNIRFENGKWEYSEVLSNTVSRKQYPNYDDADAEDYLASSCRVAYIAYDGENCVGQILIAKTWNVYAHIEDISVAEAYRGQGIGTMLLGKAETWAKTNNLNALSLECQDNNVLASRFYKKNGFVIGGVNTELYAMLGEPYASETAVFWYKKLG